MPLFKAAWKGAQTINEAVEDHLTSLTSWLVSHLLPLIQAGTTLWDSFRLVEAIHLLKAFSLVSTDTNEGFLSVSMHPLVHAWARDRLSAKQQHEYWVITGCLVCHLPQRHYTVAETRTATPASSADSDIVEDERDVYF
jgi:hypothetical protein